jgi:hypothetical protein
MASHVRIETMGFDQAKERLVGNTPSRSSRLRGALRSQPCAVLATLLLLFTTCGSMCQWRQPELLPYTLPPSAPLDQLTGAVNDNSAKVGSYTTTQATLSVPGVPSLPVNIAAVPPLKFRMRASLPVVGPEVDLGSNDELFWFWIRRSQPPAMYFCRHDQFAASAARQIMPVEPEWIVDALGLPRFSPIDQPQGPFPVGEGRVQIRTIRHSAVGDLTKVTVLDERRGLVLEQDLYDRTGARIASAFTSDHRRDPVTGAIMPTKIRIQFPSANLDLNIDAPAFQINTMGQANTALWTKPQYAGFPDVNLASINPAAPPGPAVVPLSAPPVAAPNGYPPAGAGYPPPAATYVMPQTIPR